MKSARWTHVAWIAVPVLIMWSLGAASPVEAQAGWDKPPATSLSGPYDGTGPDGAAGTADDYDGTNNSPDLRGPDKTPGTADDLKIYIWGTGATGGCFKNTVTNCAGSTGAKSAEWTLEQVVNAEACTITSTLKNTSDGEPACPGTGCITAPWSSPRLPNLEAAVRAALDMAPGESVSAVDGPGSPPCKLRRASYSMAWNPETAADPAVVLESGECTLDDCRDNFQASLFIGSAIDTFAADDLLRYLNPDAAGETDLFERLIGGVDFAYRLSGDPEALGRGAKQLWVYGWTVHGVRSTDIDCKESENLFVCQEELEKLGRDEFGEQFLFALRNATSLEAALGLRWEFLQLQGDSLNERTSARLFLSAQAGFVRVSGDDDDVLDDHLLGVGAIATNGKFEGSYLQVGFGTSDYFEVRRDNRWKLDALLSWTPAKSDAVSFFAEITVNVDAGRGADSVQSYFGFDLNFPELKELFGATEN